LTINKSIGELTTLDGSLDKTLKASEQLKDLPQILQKYMLLGNYQIGNAKKFDSHSIFNDIGSIDGFIAQFVNLDEAQQKAFLSLSSFDEGLEDYIENTKNAVQTGEKFNSQLFEQIASQKDGITTGVLNEFMKAGGLKDAKGVLALPNTQDAIALMEDYANHCSDASKTQQLFNAGILEQENGVYKLSQAFLKEISVKQASTVATVALTAAQKAWNVVAQYGKQLLLSLGVAAVAFIATKIVDYLMNLKTHSEELVAAMNDSHDAAQQATKDVEEIQSKIDELNKSLKDAGVKKIEDIVDPAERERLQAINDMLQAQLELKKQLEKDANDKANTDTSAVVNDKTEDSIVKSRTVNVSYAEGGANAGTHQVAEKVSKTESLNEHSDYLDQLVQKRREMAAAGEEETQAYKDNEVEIEKEKTKIEELSSAVSEQMSNYSTDADNFDQYKDEYVTGTNAMTAATKALADAQDSTGIDTTNLDIFSEKVKQIKNDIDNGDSQQSDWKTFNGLDAFSGMSGEAIINIDKDSSHQTETETAALEKLHKTADENKISFESLIGVFESFGLVQISNSATADDYADKLEKTMGVIDNIQSAYKACSNAVEEYNKYGYMSVDSLQALLQMDDQYLNALELVNGKLQVNQSAYADLLATQYAEAQMEAISQAISELNAIAKGDAAEKAETFTEATEDEKNKLAALCPALKDATIGTGELAAALAAAQSAGEGGNADAVQAKIDGVMNALNTRLTLIKTNMQSAMSGASALKNQMNGFDTGKKTKKAASSITDLASAFDTLKEAMNEYNKYGYLSYDTTKSLVGLEDVYTECLTKNNGKLEINTAKLRKFIKTQLEAANASDDGGKSAAEMTKILNWLNSSVDSETISFNQLTDAIKGYGTALDEATGKTDEFQSGMQTLHELFTIDHANGDQIVDYDTLKKVTDLIAKHPEMNGIFLDENGNLNVDDDKIKEAAKVLIQDVITAATDSNQPGLAKLWTDRLAGLTSGNISMTDFWNGFGTDIEDANTKIDKFQSTFSTFRNAYEEIRDTGSLKSQDILQELGQIDQSFLDQFKNVNGDYEIDAKGLRDMYVATLEPLMKQFEGTTYGDYLQQMYDAVRAPTQEEYDALVKATLEYKIAEEKYNRAITQIDSSDLSEDEKKSLREEAINELTEVYNKKYQDLQETDAEVMAKLIAHWEDAKNSVESFKNALSAVKDLLTDFLSVFENYNSDKDNDLKIWGEAMTEHIDDQIEALNKQKEALEKANDEEERAITLAKLQAELEKARTQRTVRKYTSNGYEWVADASAVKEAQDNLNDQQRTWRKEDAEKAIDDQIDKLNELKDKYSEIINLIGTSWDDYNKKLKYSAEIADMTFTEMEGRLDVFKGNVLGAMQSTKATSGIQDIISKLESLITTLEKVNNLYSWAESGFTDYTDKGFNGLIKTAKKIFGSTGSDGKLNISISTGLKNIGQTVKNAFSGTSGNSITKAFQAGWEAISSGAKGLFSGSGANSLTTIFSNGLSGISDFIGSAFKGLGSTFASGGQILVKAAGSVATKIGSALGIGGSVAAGGATAAGGGVAIAGASAIPVIGAIVAGVVNGINTNIRLIKDQKKIWSSDDKIGTKIVKSVGNTVWRYSPIGMIASTIQNISGFVKKIFGIESKKDKNNGTSSNGKIDVGSIVINSPDSPASNANSGTPGSDTGTTKQSFWDRIKNSKLWFWNWGKRAVGDKDVKHSGMYNVDEQGPELLVRQPASGRYTYLETGDGVVPADITSKLFEMGGNTDKWFADQLSKNGALNNIQNKTIGDTISVGDIYIQNPVGDTDALAREIVRDLPIKLRQQQGRR
jgi:hypothetical protein